MAYDIATKCIYGYEKKKNPYDQTGTITTPIYQTATFEHPQVGMSTGYDYSRLQNPTRQNVEEIVASLEEGIDALAFSSGMAAISAMMELFRPGDHLITDADLYGGSIRLFDHISEKNGITFDHIQFFKDNVEDYIRENTKAVILETPTNPMMNVIDLQEIASITKKHGLLLIVDNTFLTPYFQRPLTLGADLVIHSGTKFLGGHNDTVCGFLVTNSEEISEKLRFIMKTVGYGLSPFDSFLVARGIKTLPIRMEKAQENAQAIVVFLQNEPKVTNVYYPGIEGTREYEICKKQSSGFGSMLTFEVESAALARHILKATRMIPFAESLGGTETLITYPCTQTHADVPEEVRIKNGLTDRIIRLSAGIEGIQDIIADLKQAIDSFEEIQQEKQ